MTTTSELRSALADVRSEAEAMRRYHQIVEGRGDCLSSWGAGADRLDAAAAALEAAIADREWLDATLTVPGPRPDVHRQIEQRHRHEWPTLWSAIDRLRGVR